jgi:hypothetical protein
MSRSEQDRQAVTVEMDLTPEQVAEAFWRLDNNQQAEFYAWLWRKAGGFPLSMQSHYVMHAIGELAERGEYDAMHGWQTFHDERADYTVTSTELRAMAAKRGIAALASKGGQQG